MQIHNHEQQLLINYNYERECVCLINIQRVIELHLCRILYINSGLTLHDLLTSLVDYSLDVM
jgi:hypothetical protein